MIVFHVQGARDAFLGAIAEAEAGKAALIRAVMQGGGRGAGGNALVVEAAGHMTGVLVAAAVGDERLHFGGQLAGELADGGSHLGAADHAQVRRNGRIMHHGVGIAFAAGVAAAAAVGAGQAVGNFSTMGSSWTAKTREATESRTAATKPSPVRASME